MADELSDEQFLGAQQTQPRELSDAEFLAQPVAQQTTPPPPSTARGMDQYISAIPKEGETLGAMNERFAGDHPLLENAAKGAEDVVKGFVPRSLEQVGEFLTPAVGAVRTVAETPQRLSDILFRDENKSFDEAARQAFPESQTLAEAEKTAPYSRERFAAGFGTLANVLFGAAIGKGLATPHLESSPLVEQTNRDLAAATERTANAIREPTTTQPYGVRPEPEMPQETQAPAAGVGSEGVPEVRQGAEVPGSQPAEVKPETDTATEVTDHPTVEVPLSKITLSKDVPQFKAGANEKGVVEPIAGKYERVGTAPVQLWQRNDGSLELISGRHRLDLAQRTGEKTIPSQIHYESKGFDATQAARLDAELNIRDNQGSTGDYANYFKNSGVSEADAEARGLLARAKGKAGFAIARDGSEDLFALHQSGRLTDAQAESIARAAPGNAGAQQVGIRAALDGKSADFAANLIKAATSRTAAAPQTGDLFSFDDTAMREMEAQAKRASEEQRGLREQINAVQGAAKKPQVAAKLGVDVKDPEGVQKRVAELKGELSRWENWPTQPDLVARTRSEAPSVETVSISRFGEKQTPAPAAPPTPKLLPGETQGDLISSTQTEPMKLAGETIPASETHPALESHDWTEATQPDTATLPLEDYAAQLRQKLKPFSPNKEGGFVLNDDVKFKDVVDNVKDFGQRVFEKGMDFAKWSAEMVRHLGESVRGVLKTVWDSVTGKNILPHARESGAIGGIGIRKRTQLDEATGKRSERLQRSFADAERAQKEIRKAVPSERRQNAVSIWMEAGGDAKTLDQWASAAKGKEFKQAAEDAKNLKPEEIAIAKKAEGAFDVLANRGKSYDVLSNQRDNYVPHVWDVSKKGTGIGSSKLTDKFKFAKARKFDNFFEGDQAGFKPKTMAIGKLLPSYLHEMNKVIADRQFVQDVAHMTASDQRPLVIPRGNAKTVDTTDYVVRDQSGNPLPKFQKSVYETRAEAQAALKPGQTIEERPSSSALVNPRGFAKSVDAQGNPIEQGDYKVLDQPALNNWRWVETDPNGNTTVLKSDLAVHPELAKRLNAMTGQSAIRQWYNEPSTGLSVIPKAIVKGLDVGQAVMKREMLGLLAPFHQVQEGTHAIGHTVNPFFNVPKLDRLTPAQADAVQHGLTLLPERTSAQSYIEGVGGRNTFISQLSRWLGKKVGDNVAGRAIGMVSNVIDGYQDFLFHQYIPGLKFKTYDHILERNRVRYADELKSGKVTDSDVKLLSAQQTDAAYGHLNYALLDRNPTMQHLLQLSLLAPDFLEARGRFVGQSLKSLVGEKAGAEQFRAIAVLAATQAGAMYTLAHVLGGEWDAKHPFEMTVGNRRYTLRSVPEDLHRLFFQGPDVRREFVSARINPALQKGVQLETGRNYRGEKTTSMETMGELLANYIPITIRPLPGLRNLTSTSKNSPVSPLEQLAGAMGLKISRYSAITKMHQVASQWMDKQGMPRDRGVYPVSKFQPLRYALEDGDLARAKSEWDALSKGATDKSKLVKGFHQSIDHPYTGSQSSDEKFKASLSPSDQKLFDHAAEVKKGILLKFGAVSGSSAGGSTGRSRSRSMAPIQR